MNAYTAGDQKSPSVAIEPSGAFVVAWTSDGQDGSSDGVFGRRFDASGNALGNDFLANTVTAGAQSQANVGVDSTGSFLVTWSSTDGSNLGIFGRRFDGSGVAQGPEFQINSYTTNSQSYGKLAMNPAGNFVVTWTSYGQDGAYEGVYAKRGDLHAAQPYAVDAHGSGSTSNLNGVLEPGETVVVEPSWKDTITVPLTFTGTASNLTGPSGPTYAIPDSSADYGTVAPGATTNCYDATGAHDCYLMTVSGARPLPHWDATFQETLSDGFVKTWTMHVGDSFTDVPTSQQFYKYIETIFHNGITGGCGSGTYCPTSSVTRAQMAVFLLKSAHGASFVPPPCAGIFGDVACPSLFADWIEELANEGITGGCGGGDYCPDNAVTRAQMAVFLLKASHGSSYVPPACAGIFTDVPCPSQFAELDRGALRGGDHGRVRPQRLLSRLAEQPRPDGRLPHQDLLPPALRSVAAAAAGERLGQPRGVGDQQEVDERVKGVERAREVRRRLRERTHAESETGHRDEEDESLAEEAPPPRRRAPSGGGRREVAGEENGRPGQRVRAEGGARPAPDTEGRGPRRLRMLGRPLEVAERRPERPHLPRRPLEPFAEPRRVSRVEAQHRPIADRMEETHAELRSEERRVLRVGARADVADPCGIETELRGVVRRRRRMAEDVVEHELEHRRLAQRVRRVPTVPDGEGTERGGEPRRRAAPRRAPRRPREAHPEDSEERRREPLLGLGSHEEERRGEVRGQPRPREPSSSDALGGDGDREKQEEKRRRLAVEGVERRDVADVRECEHEEARGDGLRRRCELAAGADDGRDPEEEERGVDGGERAQVEHVPAEEEPMGAAGGEREEGLGGVIAAPEPARPNDGVVRPQKSEVALGVVGGRVPETRVSHHPLVVGVVGETDDRRHEELEDERRRGADEGGGGEHEIDLPASVPVRRHRSR